MKRMAAMAIVSVALLLGVQKLGQILAAQLPLLAILFPLVVFFLSLFLQLAAKNRVLVAGIVSIAFVLGAFLLFDHTFLIWAVAYTVLALKATLLADLLALLRQPRQP